ncbi:relaxase/mobilization nuclease domain-containing protein, partial [Helicobacter cetorum]|uniref:relaxase/mobilization nuclease domain-containing protein n=1 Tax=Helicobacter cetorum TaxID=138563 RepID=UPI001315341A
MVATKNNSILEDEEPLFKFEKIKPKKVLRPRTTYTQRLRYALRVANNHIKNNTKPFKPTQKQVVIKNIGNLSIEHTRNAGEYVAKDEEFVLNEFYQEVNLDETLNEWEQDFLITKKHNSKNMAMHLVFSIDEPITEKNLNILQYSVYQTLINHLGYDYPFIIQTHSHQNKPHVHVVLNKTNKLTGKKLHFKSKVECKEFFDDLREDFKDFLFTNSRAELDYSNVPNVEKHLLNIEQELQELKTKQKEIPLNAHSFFDMAFKNFNQALIPLLQTY